MDFELSKENILPLAGGRNVQQLGMALQAQTSRESQLELLQQKEQWETLIKSYNGDDPLENYYRYISWIEQAYPKHGHEGNLVPLLEHCLNLFENDERYRNERRFCKLWIKYIDLQQNPFELYHMMKAKGLCVGCAEFYKAWAYYHEAAGDFQSANRVFEEGIKNNAQPFDDLINAHQTLIMAVGQHVLYGTDQCRLVEKRQALTALHTYKPGRVSNVRVPSINGRVIVPANNGAGTSRSNAPVCVYEAQQGDQAAGISADAPPTSIIAATKRQEVPKENTLKAGPWSGTVPVKKRVIGSDAGRVAGFLVHEDTEEPRRGLRLPRNYPRETLEDYTDWHVEVSFPDPPNPDERYMYPKHLVYANPNTEFSIEEVKARRYLIRTSQQSESILIDDDEVEFVDATASQGHAQQRPSPMRGHSSMQHHPSPMQPQQQMRHVAAPTQSHESPPVPPIPFKISPRRELHSATSSPMQTQRVSTASPMQNRHLATASAMQTQRVSTTSPMQNQHLATTSAMQTQRVSTASPMQNQHLATTSAMQTQRVSTASPMQNQHLATTSPMQTQHLATASPMQTQHLEATSPMQTQHLATASPMQNQHLATASPMQNQHLATASPVQNQHLSLPSPMQSQHLETLSSMQTQQSPMDTQQSPMQDGAWGLAPPAKFNIWQSPDCKAESNFEIFDQLFEQNQPKGSAMKTAFKVLNADELAETGSRGGMDVAVTAQPTDSAQRVSLFSDSYNEEFDETPNTNVFLCLDAMQVSTPLKKNMLSTITEENTLSGSSQFASGGSGGLVQPSMISEEHNSNLAQNLMANAELRSVLGNLIDIGTTQTGGRENQSNTMHSTMLESTMRDLPLPASVKPLDFVPSDPFKSQLINQLLERVAFPGPHTFGYFEVPFIPRLCIKKEPTCVGRERYIVDKQLGKGTFGTVYKAVDLASAMTVAMKFQKPANKWEYYICRELQSRLANHPLRDRFMDVPLAYFGDQASLIVSTYMPGGSLLNLANMHKLKLGKTLKECLVVYFCIQMLEIVQAMHKVKIIHADIKPDNFLVFVTPENTVGLQLIDFGCSIDMSLFPQNASFRRRVTTEDFVCCEMLDGRPWNYHTDLFCIGSTAHVLLFDTYIKLQKKDNLWSIQQRFPRYLKVDLWNMFFSSLLNQQTGPADAASLILLFEEALETLNKDTISALPSQMRIIVNLLKNR